LTIIDIQLVVAGFRWRSRHSSIQRYLARRVSG